MAVSAFDTHKAVKDLREAGFGEEQAEAMVATVGQAASQNIQNFATKTDIAVLKSDIAVLKSDVVVLKSDIEGRIARMTLYLVMAMVGVMGAGTAFLALFLGNGG